MSSSDSWLHQSVNHYLPLNGKIHTWETRNSSLGQGFLRGSRTSFFSRALAADLANFPGQELDCVLLQYDNDLLLASTTQALCLEGTKGPSLLVRGSWVLGIKEKGTPERHCPQMWNASDQRIG